MKLKSFSFILIIAGLASSVRGQTGDDAPQKKGVASLTPFSVDAPKKLERKKLRRLTPRLTPLPRAGESTEKIPCSKSYGRSLSSQGILYNYSLRNTSGSDTWHYDSIPQGKTVTFNFSNSRDHFVESYEEDQYSAIIDGKWKVVGTSKNPNVQRKRWRYVLEFDTNYSCDDTGQRNDGRHGHITYEVLE